VTSNQRNVAPVRWQASCHGTMFEWCSMTETTISSPGPSEADSVWAAEVQRLRGVLREDDLLGARRPDERGDRRTRPLERRCRLRAEHVHGTGDVRVVREVVVRDGVDDLPGLLARVAGVEVGQRVRADASRQNREVSAHRLDVVRFGHACVATFVYFS